MAAAGGQPDFFDFLGFRVRCLHAQPDSAYSILEWHAPPSSGGPPLHVYDHTEEKFYVVQGQLALLIDGQELILEPGSYTPVRPRLRCISRRSPRQGSSST